MNNKLLTTLSGLGICGALLAAGLMVPGQVGSRADGDGKDSLLVEALEADTTETVAPADSRPMRRRASLSMPYFSFAQSLRPRG